MSLIRCGNWLPRMKIRVKGPNFLHSRQGSRRFTSSGVQTSACTQEQSHRTAILALSLIGSRRAGRAIPPEVNCQEQRRVWGEEGAHKEVFPPFIFRSAELGFQPEKDHFMKSFAGCFLFCSVLLSGFCRYTHQCQDQSQHRIFMNNFNSDPAFRTFRVCSAGRSISTQRRPSVPRPGFAMSRWSLVLAICTVAVCRFRPRSLTVGAILAPPPGRVPAIGPSG